MRPLYEINAEYQEISRAVELYIEENGGEIPPNLESQLESISQERIQKIISVSLFLKNTLSYAASIREEERKLAARRKPLDNLAERLEKLILATIEPGETIKDSRVALSWRKSVSTEIVDPDSVPDHFVDLIRKVRVEEIKRDLKAGAEYPFARLVENNNLQIK